MKDITIKLSFILEAILLWIIPVKSNAEIFTRQSILNRTTNYTNLIFTPSVDTARIYDYKGNWIKPTFKRSNSSSQPQAYFEAGKSYIGEAYVWGGIDGWQNFSSRIFSNVCPGGYNTGLYGYWIPGKASSGSAARRYLAGIDCASFVNQCLNLNSTQGIPGLRDRTLKINRNDMKPADILISSHHTALTVYGDASKVVQSISSYSYPPPHVTQIYGWPSGISYESYSIFPVFSSPHPKDGATDVPLSVDISVDIAVNGKHGVITKSGVSVKLDDEIVDDFTLKSLGKGKYRVKFHKDFIEFCKFKHIVKVTADNGMWDVGNIYRDNCEWEFETVKPKISFFINPPWADVNPGESATHKVDVKIKEKGSKTESKTLSNEGKFDVKVHVEGEEAMGWEASGLPIDENLKMGIGDEWNTSYTVKNNTSIDQFAAEGSVCASCITKKGETYNWTAGPEHAYDHPDEDNGPSGPPQYPNEIVYDPPGHPSPIGIFLRSWGGATARILGKYGIPVRGVKPDLKIVESPDKPLNDLKVLLIGSAGLMGMNSPTFKSKLADFVNNGGTIIAFTQQHGQEWNVLPVPEGETLAGYGWSEDMSCHYRAVGMMNYHQILASQESTLVDANVDGYFYEWPESAEFLLARTANSMPALLMWHYGNGYVILSSLYSDWGYGHSCATSSEINIIRDMISWAVEPVDSLPEYHSSDSITLPVKVGSKKWEVKLPAAIRV